MSLNFALLRRFWVWPLVLLLLGSAWWAVHRQHDPDAGKLRVTVLDVGQGDSILVETPQGRAMLIDGGGLNDESQTGESDPGQKIVVPYLHYRGINRIDVLVLTHPHGDHVGGLPAVLREESVGVVLDGTVLPYPGPGYAAFLGEIKSRRIPYRQARRGMTLDLGDGVRVEVLNPPSQGTPYGLGADDATINNYSAVLRLTYGRTAFLLTGDAEFEAEQSMLAACPDLSADVLKAGHHGAGNATGDDWLARVRPRFAAISCGRHNHFNHPNPATLARLSAHGVHTFRTDQNGAIVFVSDGHTVTARPFLP